MQAASSFSSDDGLEMLQVVQPTARPSNKARTFSEQDKLKLSNVMNRLNIVKSHSQAKRIKAKNEKNKLAARFETKVLKFFNKEKKKSQVKIVEGTVIVEVDNVQQTFKLGRLRSDENKVLNQLVKNAASTWKKKINLNKTKVQWATFDEMNAGNKDAPTLKLDKPKPVKRARKNSSSSSDGSSSSDSDSSDDGMTAVKFNKSSRTKRGKGTQKYALGNILGNIHEFVFNKNEHLQFLPDEMFIQVDEFDIDVNKKLGAGMFGDVYAGKKTDGTDVACKICKVVDEANFGLFCEEIRLCNQVAGNENVLGLCAVYNPQVDIDSIYGEYMLITDFMSKGSLHGFLKAKSNASFKIKTLISFCLQTAKGVAFLHQQKILHGDLATRNLLLAGDEPNYLVKVADFGKSEDAELVKDEEGNECLQAINLINRKEVQPWRWLPPELYMDGGLSDSSDVWAYGVVIWEIFAKGQTPYRGIKMMTQFVLDGMRLPQISKMPKCIYLLMMRIFDVNAGARPSLGKIIEAFEQFEKDPETFKIKMDEQVTGRVIKKRVKIRHFEHEKKLEIDLEQMFDDQGNTELSLPYSEATFVEQVDQPKVTYVNIYKVEDKATTYAKLYDYGDFNSDDDAETYELYE